ncbi:Ku protein, partial [Tardiphaga sp.]|uniref:non-homologous end joining protein Ku n=1 Tax=Tardiphaga sp. TaxID=1926292 RepID=UPI002A5F552E|nr:putative repair protein [Tardiphaga sp.]
MAPRSLASLTLSFGLVSVPVKLFSATESKSGVGFNLMHKDCGTRLKQQHVCPADNKVVERSEMVKGYEFEKDKYVIFEPSELEALEASASHTIDIVAFMPTDAIDPFYMDKAYYLAPDKRGGKPYQLLFQAMRQSGTCALAKWVSRGSSTWFRFAQDTTESFCNSYFYGDEV